MPVLTMANDLARHRGLAVARAAQLTDHAVRTSAVQVHVLSRQRRAPAVDTAAAVGLECSEAAPQQHTLELLHVGDDR